MTTPTRKKSPKKAAKPANAKIVHRTKTSSAGQLALSIFETPLGWIGLLGDGQQLVSAFAGHASAKSVRAAATKRDGIYQERDWNPGLRRMVEAYSQGEIVDFSDVDIRLPQMTAFRQQVLAATRRLGYGEWATYGELAKRVGHPRAARAVGTVMSTNHFPILIPCHRVLAAGGQLGGYSSPSGTCLKVELLELEARALGLSKPRGLA